MECTKQEQVLPISREEAWDFFSRPENLDKITPAEMGFSTISAPEGQVYPGAIIIHHVKLAPAIKMKWVTEIKAVDPGFSFVDEQRYGPFGFWHHRHSFHEHQDGCLIRDLVHWKLPLEPFSLPVKALFVKKQVYDLFSHRKTVLDEYFAKTASKDRGREGEQS